MAKFNQLPEDIYILIFKNCDAASLRVLSLTSRRLNEAVKRLGWRVFVQGQFPSLKLPPVNEGGDGYGWMHLVNSLVWQSRSWDRRGLQFSGLLPYQQQSGQGRPTLTKLFHPVIDVHADLGGNEFLIWGEGENIMARLRQKGQKKDVLDWCEKTAALTLDEKPRTRHETTWMRYEGKSDNFRPGYDDIRAIKTVDHIGASREGTGLLVGRYNGDLRLVSAEPGHFGRTITKFRASRNKGQVYSVDVLRDGDNTRVAVASKSSVLIYDMAAEPRHKIDPVASWDLPPSTDSTPRQGDWNEHRHSSDLHNAVWIAGKHIAIGLHASKDPLRFLTVTPDGWVCNLAAKNIDVEANFGIEYRNICPRSLQPIAMSPTSRKESTLLLSSWKDGTCRLQDLRTPSAFDAIYQDRINPREALDSLMVYGTERFIGGGLNSATLKVFDLRWSKGYYNTLGLPSARVRARQNASIYLSKALPPGLEHAGIWALAKSSDTAPNFYVGVTGGLVEAELTETLQNGQGQIAAKRRCDPHVGFSTASQETGRPRKVAAGTYQEHSLKGYSLMETGNGIRDPNLGAIQMPGFWKIQMPPPVTHHPKLDLQWGRPVHS